MLKDKIENKIKFIYKKNKNEIRKRTKIEKKKPQTKDNCVF